jgi:hypothetical protein
MKRDIDLARQLLLDIENRGPDCSVSVLRPAANHEAEERVRYHLLLLIDAGYLKEIDRTTAGVPCVRLTDAGHELIELVRSEARWRDAKWACRERAGGLSVGVVLDLLCNWAVDARFVPRRRYAWTAPVVDGRYRGRRSPYRYEPYLETSLDESPSDEVHYVRVRPAYRNGWRQEAVDADAVRICDGEPAPSLPDYLI